MPVSKGPDCVGDEMRRFKSGELHSGKGKKPVTSKKQAIAIALSACGQSKYAEQLVALGYSEDAAAKIADFIESQKAADEVEQNSLEADIDARPGKQKPQNKTKQDPQESIATFPTVPHAEGPMIKAKGGKCPLGTKSVGAGFCKNPKAGNRQYFEVEKGKGCPPGSKSAGKGRCRVDFVEGATPSTTPSGDAPTAASRAIANTPCEQKRKREPQVVKPPEQARPTQPTQPEQPPNQTPAAVAARDAAKARAERCAKNSGTQSNNQVSRPQYKEMHQSLEEKRRKIKELQRQGHPASILIKQVKDHD